MQHEKISVLDFGGQYAHLIANRIRRLGVYSEIRDSDTPASELASYKGLILSGGPMSVYAKNAPHCDPGIFKLGIPVLGICYGHQLMQHFLGGKVASGITKEYGLADLKVEKPIGIFKGVASPARVWMSHGDTVASLGPGFVEVGRSMDLPYAAVADEKRHFYGTQFHVEVTHTPEGMKILDNFLAICKVRRDWSIEQFIEEEMAEIQRKIGDKKVFLLVSGGVDSTVAFALLEKSLGKDRVHGMLVDHGLMRLNEAAKVKKALSKAGFNNLHVADESERFLGALKGVTEPEAKRRIIGDLFWEVKESQAEKLGLNPDEWIMGQGTIYPDTIETGGTKHADRIKTHHNRVDLVQKMIAEGRAIEPLAQLYKDEVRALGEKLGLPHDIVWRQPFPGPGLGVRILCHRGKGEGGDSSPPEAGQNDIEKYIRQIDGLKDCVAQTLPVQSVGVQGDERTYRHPVVLFTKCREWDLLEKISTAITNRFFEVNRVLLALAGKPGDFLLKQCDVNRERVALLQRIDDLVTQAMLKAPSDYGIWQFPVVLVPVSTEVGGESIVLRPIVSTEAMTASFARIDWPILDKLSKKIAGHKGISHVFYDLTHKPPGTIEWE
ncbi:MAG: glutamine-hydrolyzing GMP synthase [Candidatus Peregrinibacteria bacterium]